MREKLADLEMKRDIVFKDPDFQIDMETSKLRNSCSRSSYKRRKRQSESVSSHSRSSRFPRPLATLPLVVEEEDETIRTLLANPYPPPI